MNYAALMLLVGSQASRGCHVCDSELCEGTHDLRFKRPLLFQLSYNSLVLPMGLEPMTYGLKDRCSSN